MSNCGCRSGHKPRIHPHADDRLSGLRLTILLRDEKSRCGTIGILRKGLRERYRELSSPFSHLTTAKILNFGARRRLTSRSTARICIPITSSPGNWRRNFARSRGCGRRNSTNHATPTLMVEGDRTFGLGVNRTQKDIADNLLMTTAGSQQVDQIYWLDPSTGMSYLINVYTPQPHRQRVSSLKTIPVDSTGGEGTDRDVQLLGNLADLTAEGTPGVITHGNIMPLFDIYVSAEGRDLGSARRRRTSGQKHGGRITSQRETRNSRSGFTDVRGLCRTYLRAARGNRAGLPVDRRQLSIMARPFHYHHGVAGALAGIAWALFRLTRLSEPALTGAIMTMGTGTANSILVVSYARERLRNTATRYKRRSRPEPLASARCS